MRIARLLLALLIWYGPLPAGAQGTSGSSVDLSTASLEDLMNIEITSVSRKEQRADAVPAALYVISQDDIRRSGLTSIPDLLRLVPGVQVAQINASKWAISVRGFAGLYSTKLLVLVDGRSIFNPLFATVMWDTEDVMLEDVERIEVIRGSGAAIWGAGAVNGVVNIITKSAADTRGLLVRARSGNYEHGSVAVRWGGAAGPRGSYRVYTQFAANDASVLAPATSAQDPWHRFTGGMRGDWTSGADAYQLQGTVTVGEQRPLWTNSRESGASISDTQVGNVLGRWTHAQSGGARLQLQSYFDVAHRRESIGEYSRYTVDLDAVYHAVLGRHNDLVVGGGYRYFNEAMAGGAGYVFTPGRAGELVFNAFAQHEVAFPNQHLELTLGAKFEHESNDGASLQPTARLMWNVRPRQHIWAAVSRAIRTPSLVDKGVQVDMPPIAPSAETGPLPIVATAFGNPDMDDERVVGTEIGYRLDITSKAAFDVTGFVGRYRRLQTSEPSEPALAILDGQPVVRVTSRFDNLLDADTRGFEISARVAPVKWWQVDGTFSAFHLTPKLHPSSRDPHAATFDGRAPRYQWRAHSGVSLGRHAQADVMLFHVGSQPQLPIPAYTRADARLEWTFTSRLSAEVRGQNLLSASHAEFSADQVTIVATRVPRSASLQFTWRF